MHENYARDAQCQTNMSAAAGYGLMGAQMRQEPCQTQGEAARQSAKSRLHQRIRQLRREADRLEALAKALPEELPPMADEALWDLIHKL